MESKFTQSPSDSQKPELKPCPFCAEMIQQKAIKCRFCHSTLVSDGGEELVIVPRNEVVSAPTPPSLLKLLFLNLLCPGWGAWRLGHRWRGFLIFFAITVTTLLWVKEAIPIFSEILNHAMKSGNTVINPELRSKLEECIWYSLTGWIFWYSFIDLFFIFPWSSKKKTPA